MAGKINNPQVKSVDLLVALVIISNDFVFLGVLCCQI